jgi:hypothetical protein
VDTQVEHSRRVVLSRQEHASRLLAQVERRSSLEARTISQMYDLYATYYGAPMWRSSCAAIQDTYTVTSWSAWLVSDIAARLGAKPEIIDIDPRGAVSANAAIIAERLSRLGNEPV